MRACRISEHRFTHAEGRTYLFLPAETVWYEVEPDLEALIRGHAASDRVTPADIGEDLFGELLGRRIIVPERSASFEPEIGQPFAAEPAPMNTLVLHLTDACNLACDYCCQEGSRKGRGSMSPEIAEKAVDLLMANAPEEKKVHLVFFGGEPLLNFPVISHAVAYADQRAQETGRSVGYAITTNATLLEQRVVDFLLAHEIGVTVSIDGDAPVHDRHRRFPGGAPSHRVIAPGIARLIRGGRPVVARVTVVKDPDTVPNTLDYLLKNGFAEAGFAPVTTADPAFLLDEAGMDRLLEQFRGLSERFLESAETGDLLGFTNLIDLLVALHQGEVKSHPCGAGLGLFAVDPKGRLYPCQRLCGTPHPVLGDLDTGLNTEAVADFRKKGALNTKQECANCMARATCAGGCYHEAWARQGDPFSPNRHYCRWIRGWLEIGIDTYSRLAARNPQYLDRLSALRGHAPYAGPSF